MYTQTCDICDISKDEAKDFFFGRWSTWCDKCQAKGKALDNKKFMDNEVSDDFSNLDSMDGEAQEMLADIMI